MRRARYVGSAEPNPHTIQEEAPRKHEHHLDELRRPHQIREEEDEVHKVELEQAQEWLEVLVAQKEVELEPCSTRGDREDEAQGLEQQKRWMSKLESSSKRGLCRPRCNRFSKGSARTSKLCNTGTEK